MHSEVIRTPHPERHGDQEPRKMPIYTIREAVQYLGIPEATLRSWVVGRFYETVKGKRHFKPIIKLPKSSLGRQLSFVNLVEAHVLDAIRRQHNVPLPKVRRAIEYLSRVFKSEHPLAEQEFATNGLDLFIDRYGQLINASRNGQLAMRAVLEAYLDRVERDALGHVSRLYPFVRRKELTEPKAVVIDPSISFGRPVLAGTGIPISIVASRYKTGDSMEALAEDYGRDKREIEEAIRCQLQAA